MESAAYYLPWLLGSAVLLPLCSFFAILIAGPKMGKAGEYAAYIATGAIGTAALFSFVSLFAFWLPAHSPPAESHGEEQASVAAGAEHAAAASEGHAEAASGHAEGDHHAEHAVMPTIPHFTGEFSTPVFGGPWILGQFGDLRMSISYYIDSLTVCMFCMVTFIATLIHIYAMGYMHDELHDVTDHQVHLSAGQDLHRPGRYPRFFQYLSLFCFSMLGLVIAGNIAMTFVFWELVGICSYFLIGFYVERKSASNAANKAFIVNRVGDFGMILGLMALWSGLGTFNFGDIEGQRPGLFTQVREGLPLVDGNRHLAVPASMVQWSAQRKVAELKDESQGLLGSPERDAAAFQQQLAVNTVEWRKSGYGYGLLVLAGIGIFCGCVGKSAQFPLHVWLPDAMEGPTPVSALVHSATMVAAGVYLVGRFYPVFLPEVLLVIAVIGMITLFLAATIAITATDIKRVLAYSTVSQLGYMMLALGVGGWLAGMMHLITHAFFKSLLFMGSGSVIHAVHTNEMTEMGGLRKKMPVTAYTMLVGCLAIAGAGIPFIMSLVNEPLKGLGFSGFYSKDAILEQAFSFMQHNNSALAGVFFVAAAGGAAITAFYMFRMWYLTFAGQPRDAERYDHAHESPTVMYAPLIILAVMAVAVAWSPIQAIIGGIIATVVFFTWRRVSGGAVSAASPDTPAAPGTHATHETHGHHDQHGHDHHGHDDHAHGHAHGGLPSWLGELPSAISIFVLAAAVIWLFAGMGHVTLQSLLEQSNPVGSGVGAQGYWLSDWTWPAVHHAHDFAVVVPVSLIAIGTATAGFLLATLMYGLGYLDPGEVRAQFAWVYRFLLNKWWFDELYDWMFIKPTHVVSRFISSIDRHWIDWLIDNTARVTRQFSTFWAWLSDTAIVDGFVDLFAGWTYSLGVALRSVQTGRVRQYVMFIVIGAVAIFILISFFWNPTLAG